MTFEDELKVHLKLGFVGFDRAEHIRITTFPSDCVALLGDMLTRGLTEENKQNMIKLAVCDINIEMVKDLKSYFEEHWYDKY